MRRFAALVLAATCVVPAELAPVSAAAGSLTQPRQAAVLLSNDPSTGFQIDAAHTGDQPNDPLTTPLVERWSVDLGGPTSYPVIAGGLVYATAGYSGGEGAKLFALDEGTGRSVWGPIDLGGGRWVSGLTYDAGKLFAVNEVGTCRRLMPRPAHGCGSSASR